MLCLVRQIGTCLGTWSFCLQVGGLQATTTHLRSMVVAELAAINGPPILMLIVMMMTWQGQKLPLLRKDSAVRVSVALGPGPKVPYKSPSEACRVAWAGSVAAMRKCG